MPVLGRTHPTIGFLSTWSVYEGTTIDSYTHTLLRGVRAAAREHGCNLLAGCGISLPGSPRGSRTVWTAPGPGVDFVPVGPWNTDALLVIPDDLSEAQFDQLQDLIRSGYPVVLTTPEKPGQVVAVDNAGGIRQAFDHLVEHGHRRIAFVAGKKGRGGDSAERLAAYHDSLAAWNMPEDERLVAFGEHRREDGRLAMQSILDSGAPFSALLCSNDLSALGAVEVLRSAGRRIPEDVAVIGFDDIAEARSQLPPLTTVRHPTFALGYQAVLAALAAIEGERTGEEHTRVATQLVVRQSCGCRPEDIAVISAHAAPGSPAHDGALAHAMAEAASVEVRRSPRQEVEQLCLDLLAGFAASLAGRAPGPFEASLQRLFDWLDGREEDAYTWQAAFSTLRRGLPDLLPGADPAFAAELIDRARVDIAALAQRQSAEALLRHTETSNRLGLMTAQLLASLDASDSARILAGHLPELGIAHALVAIYDGSDGGAPETSRVLLDAGLIHSQVGRVFANLEFPPPGFYPPSEPFQLAILPLVIDEGATGFVALHAAKLELGAAIVHNLESALRSSRLYRDALQGRQLAEEANRLKSRFLSMVSHELRTPLSLIVGLSEMTLRGLDSGDSSAAVPLRHDVEQINTSAQHLARLIGDVLDLASSEAGQLRILREPLDLADVLHVTARIGQEMAQEKGLAWSADLPEEGPWVLGDRTRLRQVVLNLVSNAVKFTRQGKVALSLAVSDGSAVVSVSDTGIGVPLAERETIFGEFQRSEQAVRSGYGGLGLGLAISRQLVERHGGSITLRSPGDLGEGSTFTFTLPVIAAAATRPGDGEALSPASGPVMVLTEAGDTAEQLTAYLHRRGFEVELCQVDQSIEWLSRVAASPPAALILGGGLASREGWAIIGMLKRQPSTERVPVLAYALDPDHDQGELLELNYLHKPLRADQLADALERHLSPENGEKAVLVVDDDPGILEMHSRLVAEAGCRAITARDGREALSIIERTRPDLILLDLMMPEVDGFAVLDRLRERQATRDIPVIILTARWLSDADLERCNRGVAAILNKGLFSAAETLGHIEAALGRQRTLGSATQQLVRQAMACIHARYAGPLSREEIARQVCINPDYLTDCFRQELGITPSVYLRRYRIRHARELLETTDLPITQVALAVGFSESAHFTRTFQKEVGTTPRAYRRGRTGHQ